MGENKLVSILIPCYNHENFVGDCLQSILNQTYKDYEVIICDDASRDQSVLVIKKYIKQFEERNIRFVLMENTSNCGLTANINRMLKEADGEYVKTIASDDMLFPDYLEKMTKRLQENPSFKFVFCNVIKVKESTSYPVQKENEIAPLLEHIPDCKEKMFERIFLQNFVPAPAILFRKSILTDVGGYDESIGTEDLEMTLRILKKYPEGIMGYNDELVYYRMSSNSMSSKKKNKGAGKRVWNDFKNDVAIAKKYKGDVPLSIYMKRMINLITNQIYVRIAWLLKRKNI